jgi:hypothetical protein
MDDQYNLRMAMLSIIREVRRGDARINTVGDSVHQFLDIGDVRFQLPVGGGTLERVPRWVGSPVSTVPFVPVELAELNVGFVVGQEDWLNVELVGINGIKTEAKIALHRVPPRLTP